VRQDTSAAAEIADFRTIMPLGFELVEPAVRVELTELAVDRSLAGFQLSAGA
jgi:hypothetical protein